MPVTETYEEADILRLIIQGDNQAFEWLYRRYRPRAYAITLTYMSSPQLAEDVLQEFFLKLWQKRAYLEQVTHIEDYLFITLRNMLISELRKENRQSKIRAHLQQEANWQPTAAQLAETRDLQQVVREALQELPEKQQQIYRLSREEGLSHAEIGARLQLSHRTVSNILSFVLNHLRLALRKRGYLPGIILTGTLFFC